MSSDLVPLLPKVSVGRRAAALCIDGIAVWLPSLLLGTNAIVQTIFFVLLWLILRVPIVRKNQGQSLGRWALDMKIADTRFQRIPGVQELCKREALLGSVPGLSLRRYSWDHIYQRRRLAADAAPGDRL
ncbi:RDD family protein [Microcoleus vaginatus]|uniref:RDD family protein n=1 Tax=Microcoleus vaginatus TaxID=119532 RepID=UPI00403F5155